MLGSLHSDSVGYGIKQFDETHLVWIILDWKLEVIKRPKVNEKVYIETWCNKIEKCYSYRDYIVYNEKGNILAKATSKWVLYNLIEKKLFSINETIKNAYTINENHIFDKNIQKVIMPDLEPIKQMEYTVMRRDIDSNQHVNNIKYLEFANEILPNDIFAKDFKIVEVMYKHEAHLGEKLKIYYYENNESFFIIIKDKSNTKVHAVIKYM